MAIVRGRCSNFDYCVVAERRIVLDVDVGAGAVFICPECGKALGAPLEVLRAGGRRFAVLLGAMVLVLGGGLWGAALLQPGGTVHSRLPPWLDPAAQTHAADSKPAPPEVVAAAVPMSPPKPPSVAPTLAPPPHVPPVPPRPNQPRLSEPTEIALGSAALMPLIVSVTERLAAPHAAPAAPPPPRFTFVMPANLVLPTNQPAPTQDGVYGQYHDLIDGTRRLAIGFHFAPHSLALDEAGMRDIDRLAKYATSAGAQTGRVILVGFSDNDGSRPHSLDMSRRRAAVVQALLAARGVKVGQAMAFGSDLPVAGNGSEAGRARNRRVEVFVQP